MPDSNAFKSPFATQGQGDRSRSMPRFALRKATKGMVWDTATVKVAVVDDLPTIQI
jgi:hypothetical protein